MTIFIIIAAAIVVVLLCREAILHKGDFFEKTIMAGRRISQVANEIAPPGRADNALRDKDLVKIIWIDK